MQTEGRPIHPSIPYLAITAVGMLLFLFVLYRTNLKWVSVGFLLFMIGAGFLFEFVILVLFDSYHYSPELHDNWYFDSLIGAIASNAFSLPAVATFVAVFRLHMIWCLVITASYYGVEWLFLHLEIYHQSWWKTYYTSISLILYFCLAKAWFYKLRHSPSPLMRTVTMYFISFPVATLVQFMLAAFFHTHLFTVGVFESSIYRDHVMAASLYCMFLAACLTTLTRLQCGFWWKVLGVGALVSLNVSLDQLGILEIYKPWYFVAITAHMTFQLLFLPFFDRAFLAANNLAPVKT